MAIKFKCPACGVVRSANDRLLGREISCPECGKPVQLPTAEDVEAAKQAKLAAKRERQAQLEKSAVAAVAVAPAVEAKPLSAAERLAAEERELERESTSFSKPREKQEDEMDMTPMVDVTFLLLIFFMITASFSVQKVFQRPAQKSEEPSTNVQPDPEKDQDLVTVQVDEFNAFNVVTSDWDKPVGSKQDLIVTLNDARAGDASGNQPSKLVVRAHVDCIHASVVAALDAGREANFSSFEVSTVEQFD